MQTTTVQSSELGDTWLPSDHMVRVLTAARNVRKGDQIRVREHRKGKDGESRKWHTVLVEDTQGNRAEMMLQLDKWPIAYVCAAEELVELVDIRRTVVFRCVTCHRADAQDKVQRTVSLTDFTDAGLIKSGGLQVVILPHTDPDEITGYCAEHGRAFLS